MTGGRAARARKRAVLQVAEGDEAERCCRPHPERQGRTGERVSVEKSARTGRRSEAVEPGDRAEHPAHPIPDTGA
eukprot:3593189-Rhodomonas_salina.1